MRLNIVKDVSGNAREIDTKSLKIKRDVGGVASDTEKKSTTPIRDILKENPMPISEGLKKKNEERARSGNAFAGDGTDDAIKERLAGGRASLFGVHSEDMKKLSGRDEAYKNDMRNSIIISDYVPKGDNLTKREYVNLRKASSLLPEFGSYDYFKRREEQLREKLKDIENDTDRTSWAYGVWKAGKEYPKDWKLSEDEKRKLNEKFAYQEAVIDEYEDISNQIAKFERGKGIYYTQSGARIDTDWGAEDSGYARERAEALMGTTHFGTDEYNEYKRERDIAAEKEDAYNYYEKNAGNRYDGATGQIAGNIKLGRIDIKSSNAGYTSYANSTEDITASEIYQALSERIRENNESTFKLNGGDDGLIATFARYAPQGVDQAIVGLIGGVTGALVGGVATGGAGIGKGREIGSAAASARYMYKQTAGAAFVRLLQKSNLPLEDVKKMAASEAIASSVVEFGLEFGASKLWSGFAKAGGKLAKGAVSEALSSAEEKIIKNLVKKGLSEQAAEIILKTAKTAGKLAVDAFGEGVEEWLQEGISIVSDRFANRNEAVSPFRLLTEAFDASNYTPEDAERMKKSFKAGAVIGLGQGGLNAATTYGIGKTAKKLFGNENHNGTKRESVEQTSESIGIQKLKSSLKSANVPAERQNSIVNGFVKAERSLQGTGKGITDVYNAVQRLTKLSLTEMGKDADMWAILDANVNAVTSEAEDIAYDEGLVKTYAEEYSKVLEASQPEVYESVKKAGDAAEVLREFQLKKTVPVSVRGDDLALFAKATNGFAKAVNTSASRIKRVRTLLYGENASETISRVKNGTVTTRNNDTVMLVRAGDYYVAYGGSAQILSEMLGVKTSYRTVNGNSVLTARIPVGALEAYKAKLEGVEIRVNGEENITAFDTKGKIVKGMSDAERFEILSKKSIVIPMYNQSRMDAVTDIDFSKLSTVFKKEAKPILKRLGEEFGIFKAYTNEDVEPEFDYSRYSLTESLNKQAKRYDDFAKMLTVFDDIIENAVGIEVHHDKYAGTDRADTKLLNTYVLIGGFSDMDRIIPVKLTVKELKGERNKLYLAISAEKIKAEISAQTSGTQGNRLKYAPSASVISLSDLLRNVKDESLRKYIPEQFFEIQKAAVGSQVPYGNQNAPQPTSETPLNSSSAFGNNISQNDNALKDSAGAKSDGYTDSGEALRSNGDVRVSIEGEVIPYSEKEKSNWKNSPNIVIYESDEQLNAFIIDALENKNPQRKIYFGKIPSGVANAILNKTGIDVSNHNIALKGYEVRKILLNSHGDSTSERARGQEAITPSDLKNIPKIITQPDNVTLSDKLYEGKPTLIFEKIINGKNYVVAYVSKKHKDIAIQTMYKKRSLATAENADAFPFTSETTSSTASNDTISEKSKNVNTNSTQSGGKYSENRKGDGDERNDLLHGGGERENSEGAGEQAGRVEPGARGFEKGRDTQDERRRYCEALKEKGQVKREQKHNVEADFIDKESFNEEMQAIAERNAEKGLNTEFIVGNAVVRFSGRRKLARGVYSPGTRTVIIRYDHDVFSPGQINAHEISHMEYSTSRMQKAKNIIMNSLSMSDRIKALQETADTYRGMNLSPDELIEELVCDIMAGMNEYSGKFEELAGDYWTGNDIVDRYSAAEYNKLTDAGGRMSVDDVPHNEYVQLKEYIALKNNSAKRIKKIDCKEVGENFYIWVNKSKMDWNIIESIPIRGNEDTINLMRGDIDGLNRRKRAVSVVLEALNERYRNGDRSSTADTVVRAGEADISVHNGQPASDGRGYFRESSRNSETGEVKTSDAGGRRSVEKGSPAGIDDKTKITYNPDGIKLGKKEYAKAISSISTNYREATKTHKGLQYQSVVDDKNHYLYIYEDYGFNDYKIVARVNYANEDVAHAFVEVLRRGRIDRISDVISEVSKSEAFGRSGSTLYINGIRKRRGTVGNASLSGRQPGSGTARVYGNGNDIQRNRRGNEGKRGDLKKSLEKNETIRLTNSEWSEFYRSLGELEKGLWFPRTADGEYIFEAGNKLVFTDGDFVSPMISTVISFDENVLTQHEIELGKEAVWNAATRGAICEEYSQAVRHMFGEGADVATDYRNRKADRRGSRRRSKGESGTEAYRAGGKGRNSGEIKFSVEYNNDGTPNTVVIEEDIFKGHEGEKPHKVIRDYLKKHIGEYATIIESGQKVYFGKDLPGEYTQSGYTRGLTPYKANVKNQAAQNIEEMIEISTNRQWRANTKEKHKKDAQYGWYKYSTKIRVGEASYSADILIRNAQDGKKYLYDVINIKRETVAQRSENSPYLRTAKDSGTDISETNGFSNDNISDQKQNVNDEIKLSVEDDEAFDFDAAWQDLIDFWGAMKKGEKPARDIDVPKKISKRELVSEHARTMMEAGVTPKWAIPEFEKRILNGEMTHYAISDAKASKKAGDTIREFGFEEAMQIWDSCVKTGKVGKNEIALGQLLYNQCITNKDVTRAMKIACELALEETRAGQVLQAARMLKHMGPDGELYYMEKSVQRMNREFREKPGDKFKDIKLKDELLDRYLTEKDADKRNELYDEICQDIANQMPTSMLDKWNSWRYLAMLGNPRTHIRNIAGNGVMYPAVRIKDYVAAGIEVALTASGKMKQEERTKSFTRSKAAVEFAKKDFVEMKSVLQGDNGKYAINNDIEKHRQIFKTKALERLRKKNFALLEAEDVFFLEKHYVNALARIITARGMDVDNIDNAMLDRARAIALREAQEATYRDANSLAEGLNKIQRKLANSDKAVGKVGGMLIEGVLPFKKTPMNILKRGVEYSPASIVTGLVKAARKAKANNYTTAEIVNEFAKGITGSGLILVGFFLARMGLLAAGGDDDKKKNAFDKLTGRQNYAFVFGDGSYTIDWATPSCLPLFIGAELNEMIEKRGFEPARAFEAVVTLAEPLLELSMLSGLSSTIQSAMYNDGEVLSAVATNMITSYFLQAFPTFGGQLARIFDDKQREFYFTDKTGKLPKQIQRLWGQAVSKLPFPFMRNAFAVSVDDWGREKTYGNLIERALENLVSPGYYSKENLSIVDRELERLYDKTGDGAVFPKTQAKYYVEGGVYYYMDAETWVKAKKMRGEKSFELVRELIASDYYEGLSYEEKISAIEKCYRKAGEYAKENMIKEVKRKANR